MSLGKPLRFTVVLIAACLADSAPQTPVVSPPPFLPAARNHAWAIFGWLTQPSSQPEDPSDPQHSPKFSYWQTWYQRADILAGSQPVCAQPKQPARLSGDRPFEMLDGYFAELQKAKRKHNRGTMETTNQDIKRVVKRLLGKGVVAFDPNGKLILIQTTDVLFNQKACEHIRDKGLYDTSSSNPAEMEIPPFLPGSVVVKASWYQIYGGNQGSTQLTIGDRDPDHGESIAVTIASGMDRCNLSTWRTSGVSTACFYSLKVTDTNVSEFPEEATPGDVYVLVGLHVMTKETPDWMWSTFWWSPQAATGQFADGRPPADPSQPYPILGFWRNYLMDTTLSMETPSEDQPRLAKPPADDKCGDAAIPTRAKICYNPYLETGGMTNYSLANCMNCHAHATKPEIKIQTPFSGYALRGYISPDAPCFDRHTRTDYVWSLRAIGGGPAAPFIDKLAAFTRSQLLAQEPKK